MPGVRHSPAFPSATTPAGKEVQQNPGLEVKSFLFCANGNNSLFIITIFLVNNFLVEGKYSTGVYKLGRIHLSANLCVLTRARNTQEKYLLCTEDKTTEETR